MVTEFMLVHWGLTEQNSSQSHLVQKKKISPLIEKWHLDWFVTQQEAAAKVLTCLESKATITAKICHVDEQHHCYQRKQ